MDQLALLAGSLAAIAMLTALAYALGFRQQPVLDEEAARREAAAGLPGFRPVDAVVAADGRAALVAGHDHALAPVVGHDHALALVVGHDHALALVVGHGDGWVVRRVPAGGLGRAADGGVRVLLHEPGLSGRLLALAAPPPPWLEAAI